jgi:hypothetical protein
MKTLLLLERRGILSRVLSILIGAAGSLAGISEVLARNRIGIFAISTYNTDYVLTKEENFERAIAALREAGYGVVG